MIDCPNAEMRDRLPDLANESLSPELRAIVLEHLAGCAPCSAEIEIIRMTRVVLRDATPRVNVATIVSALPRGGQARSISTARGWAPWRIAAAVTLLMAGAGSYAVMKQGNNGGVGPDSGLAATAVDTTRGLAMTGALADLSDSELQTLMDGLSTIKALPSTEVEPISVSLSGPPTSDISDTIIRDLEDL